MFSNHTLLLPYY